MILVGGPGFAWSEQLHGLETAIDADRRVQVMRDTRGSYMLSFLNGQVLTRLSLSSEACLALFDVLEQEFRGEGFPEAMS